MDPVARLCQRIAELEHLYSDDEFRARKMAACIQVYPWDPHHWYHHHVSPLYRALYIVAGLGDPNDWPLGGRTPRR